MSKIGIMGGTFNPIHNAHLIMAEEARVQFGLDKVLFMPSQNPPHKKKSEIASDAHRKRMIQHAIGGNPYFEFSDMELKREGTTYTKDTLAAFKEQNPDAQIYFILGGDSLASLESWCEPAYIFANCHILAANRGETANEKIQKWIAYYEQKYNAQISEIRMPLLSVSSEMLRHKISQGQSITNYAPACVEYYIRNNMLYGASEVVCDATKDSKTLCRVLEACLKPKRYRHTLAVAVTAANMATIHGVDSEQAYLTGLLHDCAKYFSGQEMLTLCNENHIVLTEVERQNTALIHGKLGAYFAGKKYMVQNEDMINAIAYHTTGRPAMSPLEQIIYLADYIEPNRDMKCKPHSLDDVRRMCFVDLKQAMQMALENSMSFLSRTGQIIDKSTQKTYEYYSR